jgi:hypothetical protein
MRGAAGLICRPGMMQRCGQLMPGPKHRSRPLGTGKHPPHRISLAPHQYSFGGASYMATSLAQQHAAGTDGASMADQLPRLAMLATAAQGVGMGGEDTAADPAQLSTAEQATTGCHPLNIPTSHLARSKQGGAGDECVVQPIFHLLGGLLAVCGGGEGGGAQRGAPAQPPWPPRSRRGRPLPAPCCWPVQGAAAR